MPSVSVNDPGSIERAYPKDTFRHDASRNSVANAAVLHGLRIMSEPDAAGSFEIVRAKRQAGERDPEGDTVFLPPFLQNAAGPPDGTEADYHAYIARVISAARAVSFKTPTGKDERLAGFRGG